MSYRRAWPPYVLEGILGVIPMAIINAIIYTGILQIKFIDNLFSTATPNEYIVYIGVLGIFSLLTSFNLTMMLDRLLYYSLRGDETDDG